MTSSLVWYMLRFVQLVAPLSMINIHALFASGSNPLLESKDKHSRRGERIETNLERIRSLLDH